MCPPASTGIHLLSSWTLPESGIASSNLLPQIQHDEGCLSLQNRGRASVHQVQQPWQVLHDRDCGITEKPCLWPPVDQSCTVHCSAHVDAPCHRRGVVQSDGMRLHERQGITGMACKAPAAVTLCTAACSYVLSTAVLAAATAHRLASGSAGHRWAKPGLEMQS